MQLKSNNVYDLNVRITTLDENKVVQKSQEFKNTATKRMTDSIARFLAGNAATYSQDTPTAPRGKWRPNFMSFGTVGIKQQPNGRGDATVDKEAFEDLNPDPGNRTRPWFYSTSIAMKGNRPEGPDGYWNPAVGWSPRGNGVADFQGELVTAMDPADEELWKDNGWEPIHRQQILRAEVTDDYAENRDAGVDKYSTDCILYGYASVKWVNQFFKPPVGPQLSRIAISEFGLYEYDSNHPEGNESLMAGFRVPKVEDIVYVEPGWVIMVEWRITIRATMPYENVCGCNCCCGSSSAYPLGIACDAEGVEGQEHKQVQMKATVRGPSLVDRRVIWSAYGGSSAFTYIDQNGLLSIGEDEHNVYIYVKATSAKAPEVWATSVIVRDVLHTEVGISVSVDSISDEDMQVQFSATSLTPGDTIIWSIEGNTSEFTTINQAGLLIIDDSEEAEHFVVKATSKVNQDQGKVVQSVAAMVLMGNEIITITDFTVVSN